LRENNPERSKCEGLPPPALNEAFPNVPESSQPSNVSIILEMALIGAVAVRRLS
jgi:hypothetical protein